MRFLGILALGAFLSLSPLRAEVTPEEALTIARQAAVARVPELSAPETKVARNYTDQVVALELSDPYKLNGQTYWRTWTHYEYSKIAVAQYSGIGWKVHNPRSTSPDPASVPPELEPKVLEWLGYWDSHGGVDPELKVGARTTKTHLFRFYQGFMGPSAFVGVDAEGNVFDLDIQNQLTPWREDGRSVSRMELFTRLYGVD